MKKPGEPRGIYKALTIERIDLVDHGASFDPTTGEGAHVMIAKREAWATDISKSVLSAATRNKLPNSSFAVVDAQGVGHLPYKHADGSIDLPHLRNALARLNQTKISPELKAKAKARLEAAAREHLPSHQAEKMAKADDYEEPEDGMDEDEEDGKEDGKAKKAKAKKSAEQPVDVKKAVADAIAAEVEKRQGLEAMVAKMRDEREREAYVAKAASLPTFGPKDKLGGILHAVAKALPKEDYEYLVGRMTAATKAISESALLVEAGMPEGAEETPDAAVAKIATEIRKNHPAMTTEQAYAEALATPEGRAIYAGWKRAAERGA